MGVHSAPPQVFKPIHSITDLIIGLNLLVEEII